jgi:uncharacterized protein (DUF4415 family)
MDKTDWEKLKNLSEEEIERMAAEDEENFPVSDEMWKTARVVMPSPGPKEAITIRLDPRVLSFFKENGPGYQKRINAVLEAYVNHELSKTAS